MHYIIVKSDGQLPTYGSSGAAVREAEKMVAQDRYDRVVARVETYVAAASVNTQEVK